MFSAKEFGTLDELRFEFAAAYPAVRLRVPIDVLGTVDSLLVLPHKEHSSEADTEARILDFEKSLHESRLVSEYLASQSQATLREKMGKSPNEIQGKPFAVFCLPNAGLYELMILSDRKIIDSYQKKGYCVLIWNYRGYGHSTGFPSMQNLISDGAEILKLVKHGFGASKVVVYGRSIGGHVAKSLVDEADLVIIDRSFSSISLVPRIIFGQRWVQCAYDLMIDNYEMNVRKVMESETPKILLVDPCVALNSRRLTKSSRT